MAQNNKKVITLGLDYSSFDGGMTECNRKMKLLDSEFRATSEQTKAFGDETDQLTLKQQQLTEKINLQTQKVKLSKDAYTKALESGKATDKQLDNLKISYNQNETALAKLNNELADNNKALSDSNEKAKSFGDSIRGMASSLGLEVSPALEAVASKFDGISQEMGTAIIGIGAIVGAFASCTFEAANFADELLELSDVTHITTDELQKMQYASDFLDVETEVMTGSITKLTRNMNMAREGAKLQADAFKELRIKYKETNGELRDANTVFYETIDALGKVKNETERDALAMTLMGKSAKELNPLIEAGSERLRELGIEAENMGVVMGEDSLDKLGKMKDVMDKLENTTGALKNSLGLALLPILTALFEAVSSIPTPVLTTLVILASVIASILMIVKAIKSLTDTGSAITNFFKGMDTSTIKTTAIVLGVVAALIALAAIIAVILGKSNELQSSMQSIGNSVGQVNQTVMNTQSNTARTVGSASRVNTATLNTSSDNLIKKQSPLGNYYYEKDVDYSHSSGGRDFSSNGDTYNITIDPKNVKELNDVINIAKTYKRFTRQGAVKNG